MIIILMGVAGSGKSTVGRELAARLRWKFFDADDFHPAANVEKMKTGIPLDDGDRKPWLESLQRLIRDCLAKQESAVLACSALKKNYRDSLLIDERVRLVYLKGDYRLINERLRARTDHYMNPGLLDSQFETLEEPEDALHINVKSPPDTIVDVIRKQFDL
jgi:gluconokinase